ncbi:MAG: hypothetical protein U0T82_09450 [Bacteroidales bacterium]
MKTKAKQAEVLSLAGEKVQVINDCKNMDLSKLCRDIYIIRYIDKSGNVIGQEKIVKE